MKQSQALEIMKTGVNVFLTGEPGSGKTYVVNQYVSYLRSHGISPSITASTGIAATHIGGMTTHSWSGIAIKESLSKNDLDKIATNDRVAKRIKNSHTLIIDEVSMLGPQALAMVEAVCRRIKGSKDPFGGIQVILVGDFFQLPPVSKSTQIGEHVGMEPGRFAFESSVWNKFSPAVCYLSEQHRQDDIDYLSILSSIRRNDFNDGQKEMLLTRKIQNPEGLDSVTKFYSHNVDVDRTNSQMLSKLPGMPKVFVMQGKGSKKLIENLIKGCLSPERLELKVGAVVMFTKNDFRNRYVNGTVGKILDFDKVTGYPTVKTLQGRLLEVEPTDWLMEENGTLLGKVTQLPLRLAWAITIHKSQGMSMDSAAMDLSQVFEYGQGYVALSRVRRLSGLHLFGINEKALSIDPIILEKDEKFRCECRDQLDRLASFSDEELQLKQKEFLSRCECSKKNSPPKEKKVRSDTRLATLELWQKGYPLSSIASERGLSVTTIIGHLEILAERGLVCRKDFLKLLSPRLINSFDEIATALSNCEDKKLSPVYERFFGRYSYEDLRLCRLAMD